MITPISPLPLTLPLSETKPAATTPASAEQGFTGMLNNMVNDANQSQVRADDAIKGLATGNSGEIHQVMLSMEQARLSMLAVVEVRNKLVEAYQEVSRMPM